MLLLLDSEEPGWWLAARAVEDDVLPVWLAPTSFEVGAVFVLLLSITSSPCEIKRFKEVVEAAKALESFVIVAVWI